MHSFSSPRNLGPLSLKNPFVSLPFFTSYAEANGTVSPQVLSHYSRVASSGVALVIVEASTVRDRHPSPYSIRAFGEDALPGLSSLAKTIKESGALAVLQVCHAGRFAGCPGSFAPSAVPAFGAEALMPKAMTVSDMKQCAEAFAEAAATARDAGFDGVELHGGTGYLLASFLSSRTNIRTDAYGGSVANRVRFPLEVCRAVRARVNDFPVGYRFMAREYIPGGMSLEDGCEAARLIARELQPAYMSVMAGSQECLGMLAQEKQKAPEAFMLPEAEAVKKAAPGTGVIAAGHMQSAATCARILAESPVDAIGLGRILFADNDWFLKVSGANAAAVRNCVQCHMCVKQISGGKPAFCSRWTKEEKKKFLSAVSPDRL